MAIAPGATTPQKIDLRNAELMAARLALGVGAVLLAMKFVGYALTSSSAIFSDALESIVNVIAAAMTLWALRVSHSPPDAEHPYGHGKVEFLSAGVEGGMILLAAPVIIVQAISSAFHPSLHRVDIGTGLILISLAGNAGAGMFLLAKARKGQSIALEADGRHLMADAVTSAGVLVALLVIWLTGWNWVDIVAALAVAAYLAWLAVGVLRRSVAGLLDEQDARDDAMIRPILDAHAAGGSPRVCSYHKLRHRHAGRYHWVDFHLVVPSSWNVAEGHRAAGIIEKEIEAALGEANATAHIEPCDNTACANCAAARPRPPQR